MITQTRGRYASGPLRVIEQVHLRDDRFTQYLRLNCVADLYEDMRVVFEKVWKSCRALPTPQDEAHADALVQWIE